MRNGMHFSDNTGLLYFMAGFHKLILADSEAVNQTNIIENPTRMVSEVFATRRNV